MNVSSSFIKSTNRSELVDYLEKATVVVDYGIRVVSIIGILFNLTTLVVLHNRKFKHKFYDFLRCRCVSYLFVCAIGSVYRDIPLSGQVDDYMRIIIGWYVINIPMRVVFFASGIIDVLLVLNRYVTLYNRKGSVFYTLSKKVRTNEVVLLISRKSVLADVQGCSQIFFYPLRYIYNKFV
jgi:hypothetical protein